jgi:hypothetical protein
MLGPSSSSCSACMSSSLRSRLLSVFIIICRRSRLSSFLSACVVSARRLLQLRDPSLDIFDLNGLGRVIEDCLGRPYFDGRGRVRIDHRFQQSGGCRTVPCWSRAMDLVERGPTCLTVGGVEFRHLEPAQERIAPNAGGLSLGDYPRTAPIPRERYYVLSVAGRCSGDAVRRRPIRSTSATDRGLF